MIILSHNPIVHSFISPSPPRRTMTAQFISSSKYISCYINKQKSCMNQPCTLKMYKNNQIGSVAMNSGASRRQLIKFLGFNSMIFHVGVALAAPTTMVEPPQVIRTLKLPSGVRIEEIVEGEGRKAQEGDRVQVNYACRRYNGYFVHSTVDQFSGESTPVILPLKDNQIIRGLKEVLIGMKAGGKRRALIPPTAGYTSEDLQPIPEEFGPRRSLLSHVNESLIFEVQLLKVL